MWTAAMVAFNWVLCAEVVSDAFESTFTDGSSSGQNLTLVNVLPMAEHHLFRRYAEPEFNYLNVGVLMASHLGEYTVNDGSSSDDGRRP